MNEPHHSFRKKRFPLYTLLLALLISVPAFLSAASAAENKPETPLSESPLEQQVQEWVRALSAKQPFASWNAAVTEIHALGPGTHGWLAVFKVNGEPAGYMVIYAVEDGTFRLGEYGTGSQPLYDRTVLRESLLNQEIAASDESYEAKAFYYHPLAAVWRVRTSTGAYWADAKTGELLPFENEAAETAPPLAGPDAAVQWPNAGLAVKKSVVGEAFDPYDRLPWLTGDQPLQGNEKEMQRRIAGGMHPRYVFEPYGELALYALPVVGYVEWSNGRLDLALNMEGTRFIPFEVLQAYGSFYE